MPEQTHPMVTDLPPPFLVIAGPTAAGKSDLALRLAGQLGGEIISADSMQVYRGMDIGTAKPSAAERERVRHHLLDICEVTECFDAATFATHARRAVSEIRGRGRVPILCGGTGLYLKAFLYGLADAPARDPELRAAIIATPLEDLLRELAAADPVTWERIDRQNPRRVIRAIEVIRLTGKPFSEQRSQWSGVPSRYPEALLLGVNRQPAELHRRIDARVEQMFQRGLVEETRKLLARGLDQNPIALQALGYRQVAEHLRGVRPLDQTIELVKIRTRQFAKRQMTWFRGQLPLQWVPAEDEERAIGKLLSGFARG